MITSSPYHSQIKNNFDILRIGVKMVVVATRKKIAPLKLKKKR